MLCRKWKLLFLPFVLALGACEAIDDLITPSDELPLPGTRISLQSQDRGLRTDSEIADQPIALPTPSLNQSWTHAGGNAAHAMYHLDLPGSPKEKWSASLGQGTDRSKVLLAQPIVVGDVVFAMDAQAFVSAIDRKTGQLLWTKDLADYVDDEGGFGGGLAYSEDRLYVSTGFAWVFALDAHSGEVHWSQRAPAPMRAAPVVSEGRVFIVTIDNQTLALAADDGGRLWNHFGAQQEASILGGASPAVAGRLLVTPYSSGELVALDAIDGSEHWSLDLSSPRSADPLTNLAHIRAMPVIDRDLVIAISHSGRMVAVDAATGIRKWDIELGGIQTPWVAGEFIYVLSNDAEVVAVRRRDGLIRWVQSLPQYKEGDDKEEIITWSGPVLAGDRLILAGSRELVASLSPYSGEILGYINLLDGVALSPVVAGGGLYLLLQSAELKAYE